MLQALAPRFYLVCKGFLRGAVTRSRIASNHKKPAFDRCDVSWQETRRTASFQCGALGCYWQRSLVGAAEDPCASPANAIVAENCKQGVSSDVWDVNGAGCPGVRGIATQASVLPGENVEFKIKLQFGEALKRVDIFRLGYYDGRGARLMGQATLDKYASTRAVTAICREGVAYSCAKWPVAASWSVEGPSGLYVARFVLADQTKGWRNDASPIVSDNHHAVEGRDASLPPEKLASCLRRGRQEQAAGRVETEGAARVARLFCGALF